MRTSEELVDGLHQRMKARRQRKARRRYRAVSAAAITVCVALSVFAALVVSQNPAGSTDAPIGAITGSIFAEHAALGYVVVALVAFVLGALAAILCGRMKKHMEEEAEDDDA